MRLFLKNLVILVSATFSLSVFSQIQTGGLTGKVMALGKEKASEAMVACKEDSAHFCEKMKTVEASKACLKENYNKLSDGCKKVINPAK